MLNVNYRELVIEECELINNMNPSQFIKNAWREVNGQRKLVEINYHDPDWANGYEHHLYNLRATVLSEGVAIGAFDESNKLLGFATINRKFFGKNFNYVLLDQLFISLEHRNKGIGKKLFLMIAEVARKWQADKIYICAGSAEETVGFYFVIGCIEAIEINEELYEKDPRDFQLEYLL